jgi:hypothetical protein
MHKIHSCEKFEIVRILFFYLFEKLFHVVVSVNNSTLITRQDIALHQSFFPTKKWDLSRIINRI